MSEVLTTLKYLKLYYIINFMKDFILKNEYVISNQNLYRKCVDNVYNGKNYYEVIHKLEKDNAIKRSDDWIFLYDLKEREYVNSKQEVKKCYITTKYFKGVYYIISIPEKLVKKSKKGFYYYHNTFKCLQKFIVKFYLPNNGVNN